MYLVDVGVGTSIGDKVILFLFENSLLFGKKLFLLKSLRIQIRNTAQSTLFNPFFFIYITGKFYYKSYT